MKSFKAGRALAAIMLVPALLCVRPAATARTPAPRYDIGAPVSDTVWVDPRSGDDAGSGATRSAPLATVDEAWRRIPSGSDLERGYHIMLLPGRYTAGAVPGYWESRHGTREHPVILQAADGPGTVTLPAMNIYDCRYFYLLGITTTAGGGDVLHFEQCDHILLREVAVIGTGELATYEAPQEALKVNQSRHVYLEECDISGGFDNAIDFVAVWYGHVVDSKIHRAGDWCIYVKGGSAYLTIEGNEIYDGGTGGFTAGQGTGFQFMTSPWIHYEAYDVKVMNNVVHDIEGAGLGAQGGYNILMAHNTIYRAGARSHMLEIGFGGRSCDGLPGETGRERCGEYIAEGGWGMSDTAQGEDYARIPNRNVYIYNNIFHNPAGYESRWAHLSVFGPYDNLPGTNVPLPARADDNLRLRGNVFRNGPVDHSLGLEEGACADDNADCNRAGLMNDNAFNTITPEFVAPGFGDFRPSQTDPVIVATTYVIPSFDGGDRPTTPSSPAGDPVNLVRRDRNGMERGETSTAGAYVAGSTAPPVRPRHTMPGNGMENVNRTPLLAWNPSAGADHYDIQIAYTPTFESIVAERTGIAETTADVPLEGGRRHYWRARAGSIHGWSDWSEPWSFSTAGISGVSPDDPSDTRMTPVVTADASMLRIVLEPDAVEEGSIVVTALDGRILDVIRMKAHGPHIIERDISTLPNGVYFLRRSTANGSLVRRFVVVR